MSGLRIAMLTHSTNPRGGVVHALELSEALHVQGQNVTLMAVDTAGKDFFRPVRCQTRVLPMPPGAGDLRARVERCVDTYAAHFSRADAGNYDIYHAQDAISGCALAHLAEQGRLPGGFIRTVHHLDVFADPTLAAWQSRSYRSARQVLCVSRGWVEALARDHGLAVLQVANGVNAERYTATPRPEDAALRRRLGLNRGGPAFLAVGGVEARKNTLRIFAAFLDVLRQRPAAQLLIVGGASLQDHSAYRAEFDAAVAASGLAVGPGHPLVMPGPLPDTDMPGVFRLADALVFPSLVEGFGLAVLEALVSGTPVVVSRRPPFTEYLEAADCVWIDPEDSATIAGAMLRAVEDYSPEAAKDTARRFAARFSWEAAALAHLDIYRRFLSHPS